eukprot:2753318-Amphidinium_carterae.1
MAYVSTAASATPTSPMEDSPAETVSTSAIDFDKSVLDGWKGMVNSDVMSKDEVDAYWAADPMMKKYALHAPEWMKVKEFLDVSECSVIHSDVPDHLEVIYLHSRISSLNRLLEEGDCKSRFVFPSPFQA